MSMVSVRFTRDLDSRVRSLAVADKVTVSEWIRRAVEREAWEQLRDRAGRPRDLIEGQGRPGASRALRSSLNRISTFRCQHVTASGPFVSVTCPQCGNL